MMSGCTVFGTAIGTCAIAWREPLIVGLSLPMNDGSSSIARLLQRHPDLTSTEAPSAILRVIARVVAHVGGALDDLRDVPVEPAPGAFDRTIYALTRAIPPGQTRTYGELAAAAGDATQARAVGQAMARNPVPLIVPCHRVLAAGGALGGFSAPGGTATKHRLLQLEGAAVAAQLGMFDLSPGTPR
ncbi:MAG: methylated-DNA--[protein]-cysteine S-methyltransferase [Gemmatimonadetes bacterium]|nr:methylated-DNA--[protein]-cysteine S-methyltransferase [Gemmatimonadota bacterium]